MRNVSAYISRTIVTGTMLFAASITSTAVQADIISIESNSAYSTEGIGMFTGTIEYNYTVDNYGSLILSLTNTSIADNNDDLYLTGVIFNIDSIENSAMATLISGPDEFLNAPNQNGAPYGDPFIGGAALGGNWLGGGSPKDGIIIGDTGVFEFEINANDAASLTASSFINGKFDFNFLVRFKGDLGSDKVPVPTPASFAILAVSGIVIAGGRRKRLL